MARIRGAVGRAGINRSEDVTLIQQLLNDHISQLTPLRQLEVDGAIGPATIQAIEEFQRRIVSLATPDGRVDPGGRTFHVLSFVQMPKSGAGFYSYTSADKLWGAPGTIASMQAVAQAVRAALQVDLGIGDISLRDGGLMPPHRSHRRGVDVDLRPIRVDGKRLPTHIDQDTYSRERTKRLVELLQKDPKLGSILFNDKQITGVTPWAGHDNHLHVRFKES